MVKRGDILVERLTGKPAMIIDVLSSEQVTCRFGDGRLEDRFTFEIEAPSPSIFDSIVSYATGFFSFSPKPAARPPQKASTGSRPRLARQSRSIGPHDTN